MDASKSTANRFYRPELDVVRFLAFVFVFLSHTLPQGNDPRVASFSSNFGAILHATTKACSFGLNLFFTLSAFLIFELLLRERQASGTVGVKQFYIRRILRIWPLYYLGLALGAAVALLPGGHPSDLVAMSWFVVFMGAWRVSLHGVVNNPINPLWSISVEEQFYLFAPWVVKYLNRKSFYGLCGLLILGSNAWLFFLGGRGASDTRISTDSFVQFEGFAAGILLCLLLNGRTPRIPLWSRPILLACAWACWFFANYWLHARFDGDANPGGWALMGGYALAALGSVLILVALLGLNARFIPGWAVYLGRTSFGLYVYHEFAILLVAKLWGQHPSIGGPGFIAKGILTIGLNVVIAAISYRFFETPFLKMKKRHAIIESQPV